MGNLIKELEVVQNNYKKVRMDYIERISKKNKEYDYLSYNVPIGSEIIKDIVNMITDGVTHVIKDKELVEFNTTAHEKNTIEHLPVSGINNYEQIRTAISLKNNEPIKNLNFKQIWGYSIQIIYQKENEKKTITLYKKFSYPKLLEKGVNLYLKGDVYKRITSEIISIDSAVHCFEIDNTMYVLAPTAFETFFNFNELYKQFIDSSFEQLNKLDVFENFEEFVTNCKESDTLTRRLVKVISEERLQNVKTNIDNVDEVINAFSLQVTFENKKIVYDKSKNAISDIITLIKGACVYGALDKRKYFAVDTKSLAKIDG